MALRPGSPGRDSSDSLIHRTCVVRFRADSHPLLKLIYFSPSFSKFQVFQFKLLDQSGTRKPSFLKPSPYLFTCFSTFLHLHPTSSFLQPFTTPHLCRDQVLPQLGAKGPSLASLRGARLTGEVRGGPAPTLRSMKPVIFTWTSESTRNGKLDGQDWKCLGLGTVFQVRIVTRHKPWVRRRDLSQPTAPATALGPAPCLPAPRAAPRRSWRRYA